MLPVTWSVGVPSNVPPLTTRPSWRRPWPWRRRNEVTWGTIARRRWKKQYRLSLLIDEPGVCNTIKQNYLLTALTALITALLLYGCGREHRDERSARRTIQEQERYCLSAVSLHINVSYTSLIFNVSSKAHYYKHNANFQLESKNR